MNTLIHADIFFFITTIAVIVFTILSSIALYYLIGSLKNFKEITTDLKNAVNDASDDIAELKERVSESFIFNLFFAKKPKKKTGAK